MFSVIWAFISSKIPLKVWLIAFCVLIALGAFFWFKHSIYQKGKEDAETACFNEKADALFNQIDNNTKNRTERELTDEKVRKLSNSDTDRLLFDNGWLRD